MTIIKNLKEYFDNKVFTWDKPRAMTWDGWDEWHLAAKKSNPFGYWIHETIPDFFHACLRKITDPFRNIKFWVRYRVFDRYHVIPTGLKPGYHEFDERCMNGMFNMLVYYVEYELAWRYALSDAELKKKYPWYSKGWFRFKSAPMPNEGLLHLKWESTLDSPNLPHGSRNDWQAQRAREVIDLYHWWKFIRPMRKDPMDLSGWTELCEEKRKKGIKPLSSKGMTANDKKKERAALDRCHAIEQSYEDEDTGQLIRLIKIRKGLWT